jgi:nucleoside-diphosphate-sugar epimerase
MIEHHIHEAERPARVVILGAKGFVAASAAVRLTQAGVAVLALGRDHIDLASVDAGQALAGLLRPTDALLFVSAKAPCKTLDVLVENIAMARSVCQAVAQVPVAHLVYVSSDAVYGEGETLIRETSPTVPGSLHGLMHVTREGMLRFGTRQPLAILRPSLLYGLADPHNGYGPNAFGRLAAAGKPITLFGEGEEQRDHVLIDDLAEIVYRVLTRRSTGVLNIATGLSHSFRSVAELAVARAGRPVDIVGTPRRNPITHRHFDITACLAAFPDFAYRAIAEGLPARPQEV